MYSHFIDILLVLEVWIVCLLNIGLVNVLLGS